MRSLFDLYAAQRRQGISCAALALIYPDVDALERRYRGA